MNPRLRLLVPAGMALLVLVLYLCLTILFGLENVEWTATSFLAMLDRTLGLLVFLPRWASWAVTVFVLTAAARMLLWENQNVSEGQRVAVVVTALVLLVLSAALPPLLGAVRVSEYGAWYRLDSYRAPGKERTFDGISFVWVPAGLYTMGSPDTEPGRTGDEVRRDVTFSRGFWVSRNELTVSEYKKLMGKPPEKMPNSLDIPDFPVTAVSYEEARDVAERLTKKSKATYRLPTEREWEYACRANTSTAWSFGNDATHLPEYAWYVDNSEKTPHPVGKLQPNPWQIRDMYGNAAEWCAVAEEPGKDPIQVYRGGDWEANAAQCRSAAKGLFLPRKTHPPVTVGIRLVRDP